VSLLDETLARLDLTGLRCTISRRPGAVAITRDGACRSAVAAVFVRAILSREKLDRL